MVLVHLLGDANKYTLLWDMRFRKQCCRRNASEIRTCVIGLAVPSILADHTLFILRVRRSKKNGLLGCEREGCVVLQNAWNCVPNKTVSCPRERES
jgi:hypothetical protein